MPQPSPTVVRIAASRGRGPAFPTSQQATSLVTVTPVLTVTANGPLKVIGTTANPTLTITSPLPVANGGTGTTAPSLVAGTGIAISGTWPNQTVTATGGGGTTAGVSALDNMTGRITITGTAPIVVTDGAPGTPSANQINVSLTSPLPVANGGTGTAAPGEVAGTGITLSGSFPTQTIALTVPVSVANGGTGTASPGTVAGTGIAVTGSFPTQTVALAVNVGGYVPGNGTTGGTAVLYGGTGAPAFSAPNGSVYLRYDGTPGTNIFYVNSSGASTSGTTWTAKF